MGLTAAIGTKLVAGNEEEGGDKPVEEAMPGTPIPMPMFMPRVSPAAGKGEK